MSATKNIDIELSLNLMAQARQQLKLGQLDMSNGQSHLKIAYANEEYSQAVWEQTGYTEQGRPIFFERLAVLSFMHTHNLHATGAVAYFSSTSMMFESKQPGADLSKGSLTLSTSETDGGQAGLSRFSLQDRDYKEIPYSQENIDAFHQEIERIMGRLTINNKTDLAHKEVA